jgi:hypothetical protein
MLNSLNESFELSSNAESMQFASKKNATRLLDDVFNIFALNCVEAITRDQKTSEFAKQIKVEAFADATKFLLVSARNDSTLNREFVKISFVDSTFVSRSMKLRVALLALQESD